MAENTEQDRLEAFISEVEGLPGANVGTIHEMVLELAHILLENDTDHEVRLMALEELAKESVIQTALALLQAAGQFFTAIVADEQLPEPYRQDAAAFIAEIGKLLGTPEAPEQQAPAPAPAPPDATETEPTS